MLESDGVRLEPLIVRRSLRLVDSSESHPILTLYLHFQPSIHAPYLYSQLIKPTSASNYNYVAALPPTSYAEYLTHLESSFRQNPAACNFVVYDKSYISTIQNNDDRDDDDSMEDEKRKGKIAGTIGYMKAMPSRKVIEIAFVCILPEFHVSSPFMCCVCGHCGCDKKVHFGLTLLPFSMCQRTHVATHAAGLMVKYALEAAPAGLGLQ